MQKYHGFPGWQNVAKLNREGVQRVKDPVFYAAGIFVPADLKTGVKMARNPCLRNQTEALPGTRKPKKRRIPPARPRKNKNREH
jgi:hypothetical protein